MRSPMGYGLIGFVNLSTQEVRTISIEERIAKLFLGGKGFLYYYGYKLIHPTLDPLDESNVVIVAPGLFAGLAPASSKVGFLAKSPLTRILCDSYAGQVFAAKMRWAGFSLLIITGSSDEPVYVYLDKNGIELRSARHLWGSSTWETWSAIRKELGRSVSVASIGPAGENLVRYANVIVDGFRAAGRCGIGAVMGSKKIKAIVVKATRKPLVYDEDLRRRLYLEIYRRHREDESIRAWARCGTNDGVTVCSNLSMCPGRHWNVQGTEEYSKRLGCKVVLEREAPRAVYREYAGVLWGWGCPIKCSKLARLAKKGYEYIVVKPEYENLAMLGVATEILDVDDVLMLEWRINSLGMDSISFGETVSWLMELYEKKLINDIELDGLKNKPSFGNSEAIKELADLVAYRRGIGAVLAEGVEKAALILGRGREAAVHVKGLEAAAWDPRGRRGLAVSYATADVGASHLRGWPRPHEVPSKGPATETIESLIKDRDWKALLDSLGVCSFTDYTEDEITEMYYAITGVKTHIDELLLVGWRTEALARIHAALAGRVPEYDTIPAKWMEPTSGPLVGEKAVQSWQELREAVRVFYRKRGYHESYGVPLPETLVKLGLEDVVQDALEAIEAVEKRLGVT